MKVKSKKIFITGVSGSGKTTYAKKIANKSKMQFIDFDVIFDYTKSEDYGYVKNIYESLPHRFVIDAIPFHHGWELFKEYLEQHNDVELIFMVCSNPIAWSFRIVDKWNFTTRKTREAVREVLYSSYEQYTNIYYKNLPDIEKYVKVKIYDSYTNEFISITELYRRINWSLAIYKEKK